jgi:ribosomal protein S18 acetylase RimI-like enzyme
MGITVEVAHHATEELRQGLNSLLPQLSSTASALETADLEEIISSSAITLFVASDGSAVVGSLTLVIFPIPTGLRAWIEDVVVDEKARRRGVGEALSKAALQEAQRRGVRSIDLTSRPVRESAHELYSKLGFVTRDTNVYRFLVEPPEGDLK